MIDQDQDEHQAVRELAYALWEGEGRPDGRALAHWRQAISMRSDGARKEDDGLSTAQAVLDGDPRADFPALLTKDVPGG